MFIGFNLTFMPMHWLGLQGMPRRVATYDDRFADLNMFISAASGIMTIAILIFFYNMIWSWKNGPKAPWNPWRGRTLEWLVSSPPSLFNFEATPQVVGGPYQYGVPGARHAVVFAPEEIGGELTETEKRTIVVIANETVASAPLIDEIRRRAARGPVAVHDRGGRRRLRPPGRRPAPAGRPLGSGRGGHRRQRPVVEGDPFEAARRVMDEEDVHEIMLATYPTGRSRWMDDDLVDRLRKSTGLGVTRVVVRPDEARAPLAQPGVTRIAVIADDALANGALVEVLRERADREPIATVVLYPMALDGPGWTDEAEEIRTAASERVRGAIDRLQAAGIQARGEVLDGDVAEAARVAREAHDAQAVLVVATRGGRLDSDEARAARPRRPPAPVPVERIVVDAEAPTAPSGS